MNTIVRSVSTPSTKCYQYRNVMNQPSSHVLSVALKRYAKAYQ